MPVGGRLSTSSNHPFYYATPCHLHVQDVCTFISVTDIALSGFGLLASVLVIVESNWDYDQNNIEKIILLAIFGLLAPPSILINTALLLSSCSRQCESSSFAAVRFWHGLRGFALALAILTLTIRREISVVKRLSNSVQNGTRVEIAKYVFFFFGLAVLALVALLTLYWLTRWTQSVIARAARCAKEVRLEEEAYVETTAVNFKEDAVSILLLPEDN